MASRYHSRTPARAWEEWQGPQMSNCRVHFYKYGRAADFAFRVTQHSTDDALQNKQQAFFFERLSAPLRLQTRRLVEP